MRKFFKARFARIKKSIVDASQPRNFSLSGVGPDILDTDEDRVVNQYNVYRNYILRIKKRVIAGQF